MIICAYPPCLNGVNERKQGARYCSRACQVAAYRRHYTKRTYVVLTLDEHQQLAALADDEGTTIDEIAAELIREGLTR